MQLVESTCILECINQPKHCKCFTKYCLDILGFTIACLYSNETTTVLSGSVFCSHKRKLATFNNLPKFCQTSFECSASRLAITYLFKLSACSSVVIKYLPTVNCPFLPWSLEIMTKKLFGVRNSQFAC